MTQNDEAALAVLRKYLAQRDILRMAATKRSVANGAFMAAANIVDRDNFLAKKRELDECDADVERELEERERLRNLLEAWSRGEDVLLARLAAE